MVFYVCRAVTFILRKSISHAHWVEAATFMISSSTPTTKEDQTRGTILVSAFQVGFSLFSTDCMIFKAISSLFSSHMLNGSICSICAVRTSIQDRPESANPDWLTLDVTSAAKVLPGNVLGEIVPTLRITRNRMRPTRSKLSYSAYLVATTPHKNECYHLLTPWVGGFREPFGLMAHASDGSAPWFIDLRSRGLLAHEYPPQQFTSVGALLGRDDVLEHTIGWIGHKKNRREGYKADNFNWQGRRFPVERKLFLNESDTSPAYHKATLITASVFIPNSWVDDAPAENEFVSNKGRAVQFTVELGKVLGESRQLYCHNNAFVQTGCDKEFSMHCRPSHRTHRVP